MRTDNKSSKAKKKPATGGLKQSTFSYGKKAALLEEAINQMNAGRYGRSSAVLKELLELDPHNMEARRLFATLHLRVGSLILARQAFDSLIDEAFGRQDYWLAESLLREYLEAGPRCVPYLEKLGSIHQDKGEVLEAVTEYGKAIDILIEDSDPEHSRQASQLFAKIKELAPASPVAVRLASSFDALTGELIALPPSAAASPAHSIDDDAAGSMASEQIADAMPWEQAGNAASNDEPAGFAYPQDASTDASVAWQGEEGALGDASPPYDPPMNGHDAISFDSASASAAPWSGDSAPLATEPVPFQDGPSQETQQDSDAQEVSARMPWEEGWEATIGTPDQTVTESFDVVAPTPVPDQSPAGPVTAAPNGEEFSWDAVFQNVLKVGSAPPVPTMQPLYTQEVDPGTIEIPEAVRASLPLDATEVPPAIAPMPWEQVQESAIAIPQTQTEQPVVEFPVEPPPTFHSEPVQAQDRPLSILSTDDAPETGAFSILGSSPSPSVSEPYSAPADWSLIVPATDDQTAGESADQQPSTLSFADELLQPLESAAPESSWVSEDRPLQTDEVALHEAQHGYIPFSSGEDSAETVPAPSEMTESFAQPAFQSTQRIQASESVQFVDDRPSPPAVAPVPPPEQRIQASESVQFVDDLPSPPAVAPTPLPEQRIQARESIRFVDDRPSPPAVAPAPLPEQRIQARESIRFVDDRPSPPAVAPAPLPEQRIQASESIRFVGGPPSSPLAAAPQAPSWGVQSTTYQTPTTADAVDILFESSDALTRTGTRERATQSTTKSRSRLRPKLNRLRFAISSFIGSCFSTTRAMVMLGIALVVLSCALVAAGIGAVALTWIIMEESPSPAFSSLTTKPLRMVSDVNKNGYLFLLGFDAPPGQHPIQAGYERKPDGGDLDKALACLGGPGDGSMPGQSSVSAKALSGWFGKSDSVGHFRSNRAAITGWAAQGEAMLLRYKQWQQLSFEDWGYGQTVSPPCASINIAHRLYMADGFAQGTDIGIDRLERDMEAWRNVLGQARTLPVKTLALQAINDDIAVASGLLAQPGFDDKYLGSLAKMLRPLDQAELSIRWPMQSELVAAAKTFESQLKIKREGEQAIHVAIASALPLPKQRRLNDYADYYEASDRAAVEGRHGALPKWSAYIQFPVSKMTDYFTNPIENIVGLEPLAPWDTYSGLTVDTEARLRLASLQAWIRRGSQDADLLPRIAKAGQRFYDPYTGMPMLVNRKKGVMYSVGHDGKDQDADPQSDVAVAIPAN